MFSPRIHFKPLVFCTALAALGLTTGLAVSSKRHGTDILHLFARKTMTNGGTVTNASGRVEVHQNKQGNANNQRLEIVLKNLQTNSAYQLFALLDDDTDWTYVTDLQSDANGGAA